MKIGFDAKRVFHNPTGLGSYARATIESLLEYHSDVEIFLFCPDFPKQKNNHFLKGNTFWDIKKFHQSNENNLEYQHSEFRQLKLVVSGYKNGILQNWWRRSGMIKQLVNLEIDVYHGLTNEIPNNIPKPIRKAVTIHDVIFIKYPNQYKWFDRFIYFQKTKQAVIQADTIFYTSKATQHDIHFYFGNELNKRSTQPVEKIHYQPIKRIFADLKWQPDLLEPYFIYHSTFNLRKNHLRLIQAFRQYLDHNPQVSTVNKLVLVGNGSSKDIQAVQNEILKNNLNKEIKLVLGCYDNQLVELLTKSSGFIYPSLFEGFGIPLFEAASCGIPIALSNIEVFEEFKEFLSDVNFFDPLSVESISTALVQLNLKFKDSNIRNEQSVLSKNDREKISSINLNYDRLLNQIDRSVFAENLMNIYLGNPNP